MATTTPTITYRIKELRKRANLTQDQLAELLGVHSNNVIRWEAGTYKPTDENKAKMCRIFGCSISDLMVTDSDV